MPGTGAVKIPLIIFMAPPSFSSSFSYGIIRAAVRGGLLGGFVPGARPGEAHGPEIHQVLGAKMSVLPPAPARLTAGLSRINAKFLY